MIVYKATNILNNKVYIGITTKTLEQRKKTHKRDSKRMDNYFYRAIRKYGFENFKWEIIDYADTIESLHQLEIFYIKKYDSFDNKTKGYNATSGGGSLYKVTQEERNKRSARAKGVNNPMYGVASPLKGTKFSQTHRERISKALKNKYRPHVIGGNNPAARKVRNIDTGEIFETLTQAGLAYNRARQNIGKAAKSGGKKRCAKCFWEFIE